MLLLRGKQYPNCTAMLTYKWMANGLLISARMFPGPDGGHWTPLVVASYTKRPDWSCMAHPTAPPPQLSSCSSEGPLIRVICVSHHLVSLRTHWSLVDCSLRPACCFCFWCGRFIWPLWSWGHFLEAGDRMLFLTGFPVCGLQSGSVEKNEA